MNHNFKSIMNTVDAFVDKKAKYGCSYNKAITFNNNILRSYEYVMVARMKPNHNLLTSRPWYLLNGDNIERIFTRHTGYTFNIFVLQEMPRVSFSALEAANLCQYMGTIIVPKPGLFLVDYWKDEGEYFEQIADKQKSLKQWKSEWGPGTTFVNNRNDEGQIYSVFAHRIESVLLKYRNCYYLCSRDENLYFISKLPAPAKNLNQAFEIMKPGIIRRIEKYYSTKAPSYTLGIKSYTRQGEWFFFDYYLGRKFLPQNVIKKIDQFITPMGFTYKSKLQRDFLLPQKYKDGLSRHKLTYGKKISNEYYIGCGTVRHCNIYYRSHKYEGPIYTRGSQYSKEHRYIGTGEHRMINLGEHLYVGIMNTSLGDWTQHGRID